MVAIPMMWYNHARFGSVLDFGASYQLTIVDVTDLSERYKDIPRGVYEYLISPYTVSNEFPYLICNRSIEGHTKNYYNGGIVAGILFLNLTTVICAFGFKYFKKVDDKLLKQLMILLPVVALVLCIVIVYMGASLQRYAVDFFWMFTYLAMIIWFLIYNNSNDKQKKLLYNVAFILIALSVMANIYGTYFNTELNLFLRFMEV